MTVMMVTEFHENKWTKMMVKLKLTDTRTHSSNVFQNIGFYYSVLWGMAGGMMRGMIN